MSRIQYEYEVTLHWRDGIVEKGNGWGIDRMAAAADAINSMGYGGGALAALDYWDAEPIKPEAADGPKS